MKATIVRERKRQLGRPLVAAIAGPKLIDDPILNGPSSIPPCPEANDEQVLLPHNDASNLHLIRPTRGKVLAASEPGVDARPTLDVFALCPVHKQPFMNLLTGKLPPYRWAAVGLASKKVVNQIAP